MPVTISDKDYEEYRILQHNAIFQEKLRSIKETKSLEYDIDIPIRKLVAMFALLGCEPLWSCCGFDYYGQPMHKTHEYGDSFIVFKNIDRAREIILTLESKGLIVGRGSETNKWEVWSINDVIYLRTDFDYFHTQSKYPWTMKSCIHYSELALIKINELENALFYFFGEEFVEEVTLSDSNKIQKRTLKNWQYPILEDWIIKKEYIDE